MQKLREAAFFVTMIIALLLPARIAGAEEATTQPTTAPAHKPKPGEILKVDEKSITAMPDRIFDDGVFEPVTYTIDEQTQVRIGRVVNEHTDPSGRVIRHVETDPGTVANLKVGQLVRIRADNGVADSILVMPPLPEKPQNKKQDTRR